MSRVVDRFSTKSSASHDRRHRSRRAVTSDSPTQWEGSCHDHRRNHLAYPRVSHGERVPLVPRRTCPPDWIGAASLGLDRSRRARPTALLLTVGLAQASRGCETAEDTIRPALDAQRGLGLTCEGGTGSAQGSGVTAAQVVGSIQPIAPAARARLPRGEMGVASGPLGFADVL